MGLEQLKQVCDQAIPVLSTDNRPKGSFRMQALTAAILALPDLDELLPGLAALRAELGGVVGQHVVNGVVRSAFLIEPVLLPAATTTRFKTRWAVESSDPRYADITDCVA